MVTTSAAGSAAVGNSRPLTIISADSHAGAQPEEYRDYFDPQYRESVDLYLEDMMVMHTLLRKLGYPFSPEVLDVVDKRGAITSGGTAGFWDAKRRLRIVAEEGVVAEIVHGGGPISGAPFCDPTGRKVSTELRAAGTTAFNRWLADYCSEDPKRLLGVAATHPFPDMEAAADTVRWAKDQGMAAVYPSRFAGADDEVPPLYDRSWDPFWKACSETGLPAHLHAGSGTPQGHLLTRAKAALKRSEEGEGSDAFGQIFEDIFQERRPLWQMMWGGVFDRFPDLRIVFAEIRAHWIPETLQRLEEENVRTGNVLKKTPHEYWAQNCAVTPTFMRWADVDVRHDVGLKRYMFGSDYPHAEGTWPNTLDHLRLVLDGVPEDDARAIVGDNVIDFYGLDRDYLEKLALQYGPAPETILGQASTVAPDLIENFDRRNGLKKYVEFEIEPFEKYMYDDTAAALAVR